MLDHAKKVELLCEEVRKLALQSEAGKEIHPIALQYSSGSSNTTRSKSYKKECSHLKFGDLNQVIQIDAEKRLARVEPRVTMEALLEATLPYGLSVPIVPEFKGITVGGAIMGGAAESSSHRWGCFNDACTAYEIICGDGRLLKATPQLNQNVFYGIAGSYGSLGILASADIQLVPIKDFVRLNYHIFSQASEAIAFMQSSMHKTDAPDFLDGIIFAKNRAVIIEGSYQSKNSSSIDLPLFSLKPITSDWYFQHMKTIAESGAFTYEELMPIDDYYFRYDQGAFWMGAYLLKPQFLVSYIGEVLLKLWKPNDRGFSQKEIERLGPIPNPNILGRTLLHPLFKSQKLWNLLHKAEEWIQARAIIQDFCIPEEKAIQFLDEILDDPRVFPLWLCPIKGTRSPQIFAPHLLSNLAAGDYFINFGIYGIPSHNSSIAQITKKLEKTTVAHGGRKVLYSKSYYTFEEFWKIYSREEYQALRKITSAHAIWHEITEKVLSD